jgi:fumarate reductase subunit D
MDETNQSQGQTQGQASQSQNQNNHDGAQNSTPYTKAPSNSSLIAVLSYIGPLVIFPALMGKNDPFIKFHAKQGLVVFVIEVAMWFLGSMFYPFWMILQIVHLATLVLSIIGIVNVVQGKQQELPLVGQFSKYFNF